MVRAFSCCFLNWCDSLAVDCWRLQGPAEVEVEQRRTNTEQKVRSKIETRRVSVNVMLTMPSVGCDSKR